MPGQGDEVAEGGVVGRLLRAPVYWAVVLLVVAAALLLARALWLPGFGTGWVSALVVLGVLGACAWRISPSQVLDTGQLRRIRDIAFVSFAAFLAVDTYAGLASATSTTMAAAIGQGYLVRHGLLMAVYAVLIPNALRQTLVALAGLAALPILVAAASSSAGGDFDRGSVLGLVIASGVAAVVLAMAAARTFDTLYEARLARRYKLVRRLGAGGMGEVWLAEHAMLARPAALKTIKGDGSGQANVAALQRFELEARTTASLRSPHTIEIYDYGTTETGAFYYAMEYLEGFDLDTLVKAHGPVVPERVVYLLRQACASLAEAHGRGLTHRDIKPANLFTCHLGGELDFLKILDFGIVKAASGKCDDGELDATISGTPAYMAPEMVAAADRVDHRADLYALGCVAYFMLTGRPVFDSATPVQHLRAHMNDEPRSVSHCSPTALPDGLEDAVMRCLRKDPGERFSTAEELSRALAACSITQPWNEDRARRWWQEVGALPALGADVAAVY